MQSFCDIKRQKSCRRFGVKIARQGFRGVGGRERARHLPRNALDGAMTDADFVSYLQDALVGP
jgi:hypothetical protein